MKKKTLITILFSNLLISCGSSFSYNCHNIIFLQDPEIGFISPLNSFITIDTYTEKQFAAIKEESDEQVLYVHRLVDRYHSYTGVNNIKTINDSYGSNEEIIVDEKLFNLIELGVQITKLTNGAFNIAMGSIIDVWKDKFNYPGTYDKDVVSSDVMNALTSVPSVDKIDQIIELNRSNLSIKLNTLEGALENVNLSLGGIGKGFALDVLSEFSLENKYNTFINAGSSSMLTIGDYPGVASDTWSIQYKNPSFDINKASTLFKINFNGTNSISTSGDIEQNFFIKDEDGNITIRHHILDMNTGYSNNYHRLVGLISEGVNCALLDAMSTALFNIEEIDDIKSCVETINNAFNVEINYFVCDPYEKDINSFKIFVNEKMNSLIDKKTISKEVKELIVVK